MQRFSFSHTLHLCLLAGWLLLAAACARPVAPTGGLRDTEPPLVDSTASTPNFSTRFNGREFSLKFNEWITLQDQLTQIVVSPPLAKPPEVKLRGKTVIFTFEENEVLRPNTTYTINFGTAVKDLHENNPAKDLRFVFSTGDFIDSLSVAGTVLDAFTSEPLENVAVMLYDILSDSVVITERPYYFSRTDKSGAFSIKNVREGVFKCVAIDDADRNLKWSGPGERIGFPDSLIQVRPGPVPQLRLKVSKEQSARGISKKDVAAYGNVKINYFSPPGMVPLQADSADVKLLPERSTDSLIVWYDLPAARSWKLIAGADTIAVKSLSPDDFRSKHRVFFAGEAPAGGGNKSRRPVVATGPAVKTIGQSPAKKALLQFGTPIVSIDTSKWLCSLDSSAMRNFSVGIDTASARTLNIDVRWQKGKSYLFTLLPGALTDFYGVQNTDTLGRKFTVAEDKQLGGLNLTLKKLKPGAGYVLRLLNGTALEDQRIFTATAEEQRFIFTNLFTAAYTVQLIEDANGNGRWDGVNYFEHRQPERLFSRKLEDLRANWEVEATLEAEETTAAKKPSKGKG